MENDVVNLTVLSVTTRNVPGIETPPPPPIVMPSRIATYDKENVVDLKKEFMNQYWTYFITTEAHLHGVSSMSLAHK